MNSGSRPSLTLDCPARYRIMVPGRLDGIWPDWAGELQVFVQAEDQELPVTTLRGILDQAGLQSVLRGLYRMGLPLLSVSCEEPGISLGGTGQAPEASKAAAAARPER